MTAPSNIKYLKKKKKNRPQCKTLVATLPIRCLLRTSKLVITENRSVFHQVTGPKTSLSSIQLRHQHYIQIQTSLSWERFDTGFAIISLLLRGKKKTTYFLHFYYSLVNTSVTSKASLYYVTAQVILSCSAFPIKSDKAIYFRGQIYLWCWILAN